MYRSNLFNQCRLCFLVFSFLLTIPNVSRAKDDSFERDLRADIAVAEEALLRVLTRQEHRYLIESPGNVRISSTPSFEDAFFFWKFYQTHFLNFDLNRIFLEYGEDRAHQFEKSVSSGGHKYPMTVQTLINNHLNLLFTLVEIHHTQIAHSDSFSNSDKLAFNRALSRLLFFTKGNPPRAVYFSDWMQQNYFRKWIEFAHSVDGVGKIQDVFRKIAYKEAGIMARILKRDTSFNYPYWLDQPIENP